MGDMFDDIKAMEGVAAASGDAIDDSGDANFNASELDDIMAEIDNLEKDFVAETTAPKAVASAPKPAIVEETTPEVIETEMTTDLEEIVEAMPVAAAAEIVATEKMEITPTPTPAPTPVESKVLTFEKKSMPVMSDAKSNVSLSASGTMTLNLTFKIGEEDATLVIDQEKGLLVSFSGVEVSLHSEKGCSVQMANGVSFSVPVQNNATEKQKKSA
jgi:hypothetical protein